jgi:hypothetical protein
VTAPTDDRKQTPVATDSGAYGQPEPGAYPPPPEANRGRGLTIGGFVLAAVSLVLLPFVLGPVGAVLGFVGYSKGDRMGRVAGFTAIACTVIGTVLSVIVFKSMRS